MKKILISAKMGLMLKYYATMTEWLQNLRAYTDQQIRFHQHNVY